MEKKLLQICDMSNCWHCLISKCSKKNHTSNCPQSLSREMTTIRSINDFSHKPAKAIAPTLEKKYYVTPDKKIQ
jgi:hypothetical protein